MPTRTLVLSLRGVCRQLRDLVNAVAHNRVSQRLHALDVLLYQWPSAKSLFTWRSHLTYLPNSVHPRKHSYRPLTSLQESTPGTRKHGNG